MPALLNVCANLVLGSLVAHFSRRSESMRSELLAWPLLFLLVFQAVVVTPVVTYLFRFYPQWSLFYWFDPQIFTTFDRWVGVLAALAVVANFAAMVGGYAVVRRGVTGGPSWLRFVPGGAAAALTLVMLWQFWERIVFVGDYDTFWRGEAQFVLRSAPGWAGVVLYGGSGAFVWWLRSRYSQREPSFFD